MQVIGDPGVLLERAQAVLERHTNAGSVDIVLRYDENDPAIVRMRAFPQPLDLHGVPSSLHGDIAFPMIARGRFIGAVAECGLGARCLGFAQRRFGTGRIIASIEALRNEIVRRLPPVEPDTVA